MMDGIEQQRAGGQDELRLRGVHRQHDTGENDPRKKNTLQHFARHEQIAWDWRRVQDSGVHNHLKTAQGCGKLHAFVEVDDYFCWSFSPSTTRTSIGRFAATSRVQQPSVYSVF